MDRRAFLGISGGLAAAAGLRVFPAAVAQDVPVGPADLTLKISEISWELGPKKVVKTTAYNDQVPGPLVRMRAGRPFSVDVVNMTKAEDIVHWHGLHIPPEVDGALQEGTPPVRPGMTRRYAFTPDPAGTRWYHSHGMADRDLRKSTYSGQFGLCLVERGDEKGDYDLDVPVLLKEFDPYFRRNGPLDVEYRTFAINGRLGGAGEPVRVRPSQRVLFRIVNASATLHHEVALPRHRFRVIALDGNPVPTPALVPVVSVAPGERVDAIVEMTQPGVWWLGEVRNDWRASGMAVAVEYAGAQGPPRWEPPPPFTWDYGRFSGTSPAREPDATLAMIFKPKDDGHHWMINGKGYPDAAEIVVEQGKRYRWVMDNQSADDHPVHLHRHTFEVTRVGDTRMSGIWKDVVVVPAWKKAEVDVPADHPGPSLFHCHQQFHMDMGFMTMMRYKG